MGPSGSGKTTLLNAVTGLIRPTAGSIHILGTRIDALSRSRRAAFRNAHIGLISQSADLLPELSTLENVILAQLFNGGPKQQIRDHGMECLERVGLSHKAEANPRTLSGGEAQRVAVARALSRSDLALIVADEPTASLDMTNAEVVARLLIQAGRTNEVGVLLATHDPRIADMCSRIHSLARTQQHIA